MYPQPMTNGPDRVATDHRTHLHRPTPRRPRRPIAAGVLSLLLALSCFAASPTWAYKAGTGASDWPSDIKEYRDIVHYLGATNRRGSSVQIGEYTLDRAAVDAFYKDKTLTDAEEKDKLIKAFDNVARYLAASDRTTRLYADIGGTVYLVTELEARHTTQNPLSDNNLPIPVDNDRLFGNVAIGYRSLADRPGTIAIGAGSDAGWRGSIAIGEGALAPSRGSIALGHASRAPHRHATALGHGSHAQGLRSTALGHGSHAQGESSTALGDRSHAQGSYSAALGHRSYASGVDSIALGRGVRATGLNSIALGAGEIPATSGAHGAYSIALGASAMTTGTNSIALGREASATGTDSIALGHRARASGNKGIAIGSASTVSAGANEVIVGTSGHTYKLPGLGKDVTSGTTRVVTVDSNGQLSIQSTTAGTASRGAGALSSDVTALNRNFGTPTEAADYEKAPAIGSGPNAPATAEQRRVVVQDTNRDGSVRLRTLDLGDLSGLDRRVTSLSERLNKATAMSSALSALPNVVPGDNRFFLGVGAGHYSSEQALAIGMSARIESRIFVNAGVAIASGDDVSVRGGVGVVW